MPINVWILVAAQALAMCTAPFIVFIGSIHGRLLAPSPEWATLPVGLVVVGTVLAIKPATWLMERLGRKPVMLLGALAGTVSGLLGALAAWNASFPFLCAAAVVGSEWPRPPSLRSALTHNSRRCIALRRDVAANEAAAQAAADAPQEGDVAAAASPTDRLGPRPTDIKGKTATRKGFSAKRSTR